MNKVEVPKNKLKDLYEKQKLTSYEIAGLYRCCQATIWKRLLAYGIKRLPNGRNTVVISKSKLKDLYMKQHLSSRKIAKLYGCAYSTVDSKIRRFGFPIKTLAKAHIITPRRNFNGSNSDKAYLIGFAMGDLRVRKMYPNSETILADCGSNKKEQIDLISDLFKPYGRVWIKENPSRENYLQIECSVNLSFDFLLKKRVLMDNWILKNRNYFLAFLAGFTDAEGCVAISKLGQAFYSLGNYNYKLLGQIRSRLIKMGFRCGELTEAKTKGRKFGSGAIHNQNYWQLRVNRKLDLLKFFDLVSPYLKHRKRIDDIEKAKQNIALRNEKYDYINMNL
ncbi:MAG: LAGLIDADG family homing endonuclease [Candidatus Pacebacteria bacterium]|nr:LAGLIDADG family homing endonuclease [Candidatus Paceibacterota bacterium]